MARELSDLKQPGLAPMEGVTNLPMRLWFWLCSAPEQMATPFLRATATYPIKEIPEDFAPELFSLREVTPYTLNPQIMTAEAEDFLRTAALFGERYEFIELNAGCPSPNCVGKGAGSSLLADQNDFAEMIATISNRIGAQRFAVKTRTGFNSTEEFPSLLDALKDIRVCRFTLHGRTRPQGYKGQADWDLINDAALRLDVPVYASGDIASRAMWTERMERYPAIAGAIIGRGALRNPWLFLSLREPQLDIAVSVETVVYALACFVLMQDLYLTNYQTLLDLAKACVFREACLLEGTKWKAVFQELSKTKYGRAIDLWDTCENFDVERKATGRMKLVWNYLRSSFPPEFFAPQTLRVPGAFAMLQSIRGLFDPNQTVPLTYQPEYNWIYNGEKNERQAALHRERAAAMVTSLPP